MKAPKNDLKHLTDEEMRDDLGRLDTSSGITLDEEAFDKAQEVAGLTAAIAESRQALADLEETRGEYVLKQEKEAMDRVLAVIERSKDALRGVTENLDELRSLVADLKGLTKRVLALRDGYLEMGKRFKEEADEVLKDIGRRKEEVRQQEAQNADDRRLIDNEREQLNVLAASLREEETKLASQRQEVEAGFAELRQSSAPKKS
jgi:prophage DNA circulation protein